MSYEIRLRRAAQKELESLSGRNYEAVAKAIESLETTPRPRGVKKLADSGLWRIKLGQYRVVYAIDDEARLIIVVRVARRKEDTYRGL